MELQRHKCQNVTLKVNFDRQEQEPVYSPTGDLVLSGWRELRRVWTNQVPWLKIRPPSSLESRPVPV